MMQNIKHKKDTRRDIHVHNKNDTTITCPGTLNPKTETKLFQTLNPKPQTL